MSRAQEIKIGCLPSPSVPAETVMQDGWLTFLLFWAVSEEISATGYLDDLGVAVVECEGCQSAKMGYPNDEGLPEHPLYSLGLEDGMGVYRVSDSSWLTDVTAQARKSRDRIWGSQATESSRAKVFHFIVPLKESTFECLSHDLRVCKFCPSFDEAFKYVIGRFGEH